MGAMTMRFCNSSDFTRNGWNRASVCKGIMRSDSGWTELEV